MIVLPVLFTILTVIAMVFYFLVFGVTSPLTFFAEGLGILLVFVLALAAGLKWIRNRL